MEESKCEVKRCRDELYLIWLGHRICQKHWELYCDGKIDLNKELGGN